VLFDPSVLDAQPLVYQESATISLEQVCAVLHEQLEAEVEYVDGALWVHRGGASIPVVKGNDRQDAGPTPGEPAPPGESGADRPERLSAWVELDGGIRTWEGVARRLADATGRVCRILVTPEGEPPEVRASAPVRAVLEAGRRLGQWTYRLETDRAGEPPVLVIRVRKGDSSEAPDLADH
jgi:hypothetical protein